MIHLKINAGKVYNNIDKRVIPKSYIPEKLAELMHDYPNSMQTDFRDYLEMSSKLPLDPVTTEIEEQNGNLILTSKTRNGFPYSTEELIDLVQDWLTEAWEYNSTFDTMARFWMSDLEDIYNKDGRAESQQYYRILSVLSSVLDVSMSELEQNIANDLTGPGGKRTWDYLSQFDPFDLAVAYMRCRELFGRGKLN